MLECLGLGWAEWPTTERLATTAHNTIAEAEADRFQYGRRPGRKWARRGQKSESKVVWF